MASFKRARQPKLSTQLLLDFDLGEESSDDSDFDPFIHKASKDDDTDKSDDSSGDDDNESESDDGSDDSTQQLKELLAGDVNGTDNLEEMLNQLDNRNDNLPKMPIKPICCVCLGDRSDDSNEIVECDSCGVSVHEGCYGVSDNVSISSTNSTCSTEPWFCEACRAGVVEPICELCPNTNGIFKETDVGKWVHLVCALYVPGVAFGEVDQLSSVTLFEMQYNKWGAKICSLCENSRYAATGVCIGCDAGMCKTYFHVTCAQSAGFLIEAHHEDADAADPFYAHCKVHSEKEMIKKRKRNFHTFRLNMQQKQKEKIALKLEDTPSPAQARIQRKLLKIQRKYANNKQLKANPWVPTQKMSRMLTTSASACKRLMSKANIMSVDVELLERQEAQITALTDIRKKWHISPAFSVEFIGYYLDRISRSKELKQQLAEMVVNNRDLSRDQDELRFNYDAQLDKNKDLKAKQEFLHSAIAQLQKQLSVLCPNKSLPSPSNIGKPQTQDPVKSSPIPSRPISVPTAAALKMGVGFPLVHLGPPGSKVDSTRLLSTQAKNSPNSNSPISVNVGTTPPSTLTTRNEPSVQNTTAVQTFSCGICKKSNDQYMLAKCDVCKLHYHLGCLNPPLTRHPKKSKLYGWQCSECDKSDESDVTHDLPKGPRKSRTRFNKEGLIVPVDDNELEERKIVKQSKQANKRRSMDTAPVADSKSCASISKNLNKSLPMSVQTSTPSKESPQLSPCLGKKSKLPVVANNKDIILKNPVVNIKKEKFGLPTKQPVVANLRSEEALLLVMQQPRATQPQEQTDNDPLALPGGSSFSSIEGNIGETNKSARKQKRKDKHKNRYNLSSDTEKSPNKEHKRKRKKKVHDIEYSNTNEPIVPKIKIKFKTLPLPGEVTPEAQFFYVSADMVRSAEEASRPTSVETVEDISTQLPIEDLISPAKSLNSSGSTKVTPTRKVSPRKASRNHTIIGRNRLSGTTYAQTLNCCVCRQSGLTSNVVTCDECRKNYHFTCLDPPLKKTPKIRGYSWHCAECDPTDDDRK